MIGEKPGVTPDDAAQRLAERGLPPGTTVEQYAEILRKRIGTTFFNEWNVEAFGPKFPRPVVAFNTQVTRDSIRHLVDGRGDINPLFRDHEYARKTKYRCMIAPPTILYSIVSGHHPVPYNSLEWYSVYGGDDIEWFCPIVEGDDVDYRTTIPTAVEVRETKTHGKAIFHYARHEYLRRGGIPIATSNFWTVLRQMDGHEGIIQERKTSIPSYTKEQIAAIHEEQDREEVRGALPRYWEDVTVGQVLPRILRGPHTVMESVAWNSGAFGSRLYISDRLFRILIENSGSFAVWDPHFNMWRNDHDDFFDKGRHGGYGTQRASWIEMVITNWMGDDGFLWKLRSEHRKYGGYGWVYACSAVVVRKFGDRGRHCVELTCRIENQDGAEILRGSATVILPSRDREYVSYPAQRP